MEHLTVQANGAALHVVRTGAGRPLLLLHGWPEFWLTWEPVMTRLASCAVASLVAQARREALSKVLA